MMRGIAVPTIVWSRAASNSVSINVPIVTITWARGNFSKVAGPGAPRLVVSSDTVTSLLFTRHAVVERRDLDRLRIRHAEDSRSAPRREWSDLTMLFGSYKIETRAYRPAVAALTDSSPPSRPDGATRLWRASGRPVIRRSPESALGEPTLRQPLTHTPR